MFRSTTEKRRWSSCLIALIVLLLCPVAGSADEAVHFIYSFEQGYSQEFKGEFSSEQNWYGNNIVTLVEMEFTESCVEVVGDTLYNFEIIFGEVSSTVRMNDRLRDQPMGEALSNQTVTYSVDRYGEVTDIKAKSYITGWRGIHQVLSDVISGWYPRLPDKSYQAGSEWKDESIEHPNDAPGLEVALATVYKFKEIKKEKGKMCAKVEGENEGIISGKMVNQFGEFVADGELKTKFEFMFDPEGAGIVKFKASMDMKMKMSDASDGPNKQDDTEVNQSYEVKKEIK